MTLKYESEILFDLMKRDGDDTPSDVLPYESELKEKYLEQVEGAYPKLRDYRSEWLHYNLVAHIPADFPVETLSNVTEATVDNVVPYAYKSAILKGNTLVNLIGEKREYISDKVSLYGWEFMLAYNLTSGKTYLAIFDVTGTIDESNSKVYLMDNGFNENTGNTGSTIPTFSLGHNVVKCIATNDIHKVLRIRTTYNKNEKFTVSNVMLIEYQEGMENWDIPYFEGMQSVKMPVLTTTGKNLFNYFDLVAGAIIWATSNNINIFEDGWYQERTDGIGFRLRKCIKVKPNTKYYANFPQEMHVMQYKANGDLIKGNYPTISTGYVTTSSETHYINLFPSGGIISVWDEAKRQEYQNCYISESEAMTSYEPYKSNILTVNEDVTLRSNGDVYDELNLLTGRLTQRIDENNEVLAQAVVKTVDLTVTDQDGNTESIIRPIEGTMHLSTSGETIKPTFSGEIPVESITQNLASFIEEWEHE